VTALVGLSSAAVTPAVTVALAVGLAGLVMRLLARPPTRTPLARTLAGRTLAGRLHEGDRAMASAGGWSVASTSVLRRTPGWRRWNERRERAARRRAWPSVADEIGSALRSGASLRQALGTVAARGGAVATRLADLVNPLGRGDDLPGAAHRWAERSMDSEERLLAEAVELAAGATRAEPALFDTVSRTLRDRSALAGEVRAQTAQVRASAATLIALPFLFTGLCALADRSVLSFLLATVPGAACLAVGAALQALALLWMHRTIAGVAR
jgi:tight adherence protein B